MKILILTLHLLWNPQADLQLADKLVEERKYSDAFSLLNDMDPDNENPEAFRRKIDICIDNYIMSIGHQMFALKNLEEGEEVKELRGKVGTYDMYSLDVTSIASKLMEKYPNDYQLKFAVGRYYHSMHLNCGDCSLSAADCINEFETLFMECYENDVYDYFSTYGIAYAKISRQEFKESVPFFKKSIELKDDYPTSHYNLSIAYLYQDDRENCLLYAKNAFERYDAPALKADAAKVVGTAYQELEKNELAYEYFSKANEINPNDFYALKPLLNLAIQLKKDELTDIRDDLFQLDTDNPTVYQELIYAYYDYGDIQDLLTYFESLKPDYSEDSATLGSLYFFTGKIHLDERNTEKAKEHLAEAKKELRKVYPEDHQVFPVIDQLLEKE